MVSMILAAEMRRLLANPPMGGLSALARWVGVSTASVSAWRDGSSTPMPERWAAIQSFFGLPDNHLERASYGNVDNEAVNWPPVTGAKPLTRLVPPADDELEVLRAQVAALSEQVTELARVVAAQGAAAGRGRRATGRGSPG